MDQGADGPVCTADTLIDSNVVDADNAPSFPLLDLPDECLLAVLRCCTQDLPSLFSAARAHSRLQQAAVLALDSITGDFNQLQVDSALLYLSRHGQHISSFEVRSKAYSSVRLTRLPAGLQLRSLCLAGLDVQLLPDSTSAGRCGVLETGAHLSKLELVACDVLDDDAATSLAAGLPQLPQLQHLSLGSLLASGGDALLLPANMLQQLRGLTYPELEDCEMEPRTLQDLQLLTKLQDMQLLTKLQDLRLTPPDSCSITAAMLASVQQLTSLRLEGTPSNKFILQPGALAGKPLLQHLCVYGFTIPGGPAGIVDLLAHLQQLTQLTYLDLSHTLQPDVVPSAAAYAALTASSALQHLDLSGCDLPADAWQHVWLAGRQFPALQVVQLYCSSPLAMCEIDLTCLVSCCPGLRELCLDFDGWIPADTFAPLRRLTGLCQLELFSGASLDYVHLHKGTFGEDAWQQLVEWCSNGRRQPVVGAPAAAPQQQQQQQQGGG